MSNDLVLELARLLAMTQTRKRAGTRHIGTDLELCGYYEGFGGLAPRPCSPRCAAVAAVLERAADELEMTVEELRGWPKRIKRAEQPRLIA